MNVNKKLGRFKQWAGERMGGEAKTSVSDEFKSLEVEMDLRNQGQHAFGHQTGPALTLLRHGPSPQIHDCVYQDPIEEK